MCEIVWFSPKIRNSEYKIMTSHPAISNLCNMPMKFELKTLRTYLWIAYLELCTLYFVNQTHSLSLYDTRNINPLFGLKEKNVCLFFRLECFRLKYVNCNKYIYVIWYLCFLLFLYKYIKLSFKYYFFYWKNNMGYSHAKEKRKA